MNVKSCMKHRVVSIPSHITIEAAAALMVEKHVGILPVVDSGGKLTGAISRLDLGLAANLSFLDFIIYAMPIVLTALFIALFLLRFLSRRDLAVRPKKVRAVMKLNPAQALNDRKTAIGCWWCWVQSSYSSSSNTCRKSARLSSPSAQQAWRSSGYGRTSRRRWSGSSGAC